jgi:mRNA interferase MazF
VEREERVERGEVWWALVDEKRPVVLLSGGDASEFRAMQIVAPATAEERRGFLLLSAEEAADPGALRRAAAASTDVRAVGVEVEIGTREGLPYEGVVRLAFPRTDNVFCTWLVTLGRDCLIERVGALSSVKLRQLENALHLSGVE